MQVKTTMIVKRTRKRSDREKLRQTESPITRMQRRFLFYCGIAGRRTRRRYSIKTSLPIRPKSDKYLSSELGDRSVMRERLRHCHGWTLTDGFRGSFVHKDATIFSPLPATFHSTARRIRDAAFDRARSIYFCRPR